jgi:large subunit ribosomal protein L9
MKVLLRRNVRKLGKIGEVVDVKPGYARNYLVPQGMATQPTESNIKQVEREKEAYLAELAKQREELSARAQVLDGKEITIPARANEEGHLYGSIGPAQITACLAENNLFVEPENIRLDHAIRQLDKYDITVEFDEDITATIAVWVVPIREGGAESPTLGAPPAEQQMALQDINKPEAAGPVETAGETATAEATAEGSEAETGGETTETSETQETTTTEPE